MYTTFSLPTLNILLPFYFFPNHSGFIVSTKII